MSKNRSVFSFCQRAPFRVHDVVQVVVMPFSHLMHTATHCLISFGSYDGKTAVAHFFAIAVESPSGEHDDMMRATVRMPTARPMRELPNAKISSGKLYGAHSFEQRLL
jgi:hypothetical protein